MIARISFLGFFLSALGAAGAHYDFVSPPVGLALCGLGLAIMAFCLPLGFLFWRLFEGSGAPWATTALGVFSLSALGYAGFLVLRNPLVDISTNTSQPPRFSGLVQILPVKGPDGKPDPAFAWPRDYDASSAGEQKSKYPGLGPVMLRASREKLYPAIVQSLKGLPPTWKVTFEDPANFHVEAEARNEFFHLVDDVVIELRPEGNITKAEFRSRSRWGAFAGLSSDFGNGIARIQFLRGWIPVVTKPIEDADVKIRAMGAPAAPPVPQSAASPAVVPATAPPNAVVPAGPKPVATASPVATTPPAAVIAPVARIPPVAAPAAKLPSQLPTNVKGAPAALPARKSP
jgi:uncharacterized protein (DUF1499 family)